MLTPNKKDVHDHKIQLKIERIFTDEMGQIKSLATSVLVWHLFSHASIIAEATSLEKRELNAMALHWKI